MLFYHTPGHTTPVKASLLQIIKALDFPGAILVVGSLICMSLALSYGGVSKSWGSADVVGLLVGSILLFLTFVAVEYLQAEDAMVVPRILQQRSIAPCAAFTFCLNSAGMARIYNLPIYFQAVDGVSPVQSGIRNLPSVLSICKRYNHTGSWRD